MEIAPKKSNLVIFSRKRILQPFPDISINNSTIPYSTSVKFLGVQLDQKLLGHAYFNSLLSKCRKLLTLLKFLCGTWWGAHPSTMLQLYRSLIRGTLEYGMIFFPTFNKSLFDKLRKVQLRAIRILLGLRNSTPNNIILSEANETPLHIRLNLMADRFIAKAFSLSDSPLLDKLSLLKIIASRRKKQELISLHFPLFSSFCNMLRFKPLYHTNRFLPQYQISFDDALFTPNIFITPPKLLNKLSPPHAQSVFMTFYDNLLTGRIAFFTDGSKGDPACYVGFAVVSLDLHLKIQKRITSYTSIYSAETFAIIDAIQIIINRQIPKATIFSDSLSVLTSITLNKQFLPNNYLVGRIRSLLSKASIMGLDVILIWIPAHVGIKGNETADRLAKQAISCGHLVSPLYLYLRLIS